MSPYNPLEEASARAFALVNIALADAGIEA